MLCELAYMIVPHSELYPLTFSSTYIMIEQSRRKAFHSMFLFTCNNRDLCVYTTNTAYMLHPDICGS